MKIHFFQHVSFEGLGIFEDWAKKPGNGLTGTRFYEDQKLPFVDICDLLIVMGGPMSIHDEDRHTWLIREKKFIEQALSRGKKILGICLGAQLLADVLGARVYKNREKEIGWFPVQKYPEASNHKLLESFDAEERVFHWHGETFDLPAASLPLFKSAGCDHQGFLYKDQALGLQFHPEITKEGIENLIENRGGELSEQGPFIQNKNALIHPFDIRRGNTLALDLINRFISL